LPFRVIVALLRRYNLMGAEGEEMRASRAFLVLVGLSVAGSVSPRLLAATSEDQYADFLRQIADEVRVIRQLRAIEARNAPPTPGPPEDNRLRHSRATR